MPTGTADPADSRPRRLSALLLSVLLAALPVLVACSDDPPADPGDRDAGVAEAIQRTLRQRARAIVQDDQVAFRRTIAARDPDFARQQDVYYRNLGQLPLGALRFDLAERTVHRRGNAYWAEVTVHLELRGYDAGPVLTRDRWRFAPTRGERRYLLTSTTDPRWEARSAPDPQPWDLGEVEVRERAGVLGVFDGTTLSTADAVLDSVSDARYEVGAVLPPEVGDPSGVVVYVLGDQSFVESIRGLPVSDPDRLDGVTVPVPRDARDGDARMASYRIVLGPHVLDESEAALDRLVRHELTHVVLGDRARSVPLWLSEGLAEYVSVQPLAPAERRLQTEALGLAATGVADVPPDDAFGGPQAEGWYAVAWWVCEYVAATYGEAALWSLLDELGKGRDQQRVVADQLGTTTSELVQQAVALMRRTYA